MVVHRDQRRADVRDVLDEFEAWLLRERSTRERTAAASTARVAGFAEWLAAPVDQSLRTLTAAQQAVRGLITVGPVQTVNQAIARLTAEAEQAEQRAARARADRAPDQRIRHRASTPQPPRDGNSQHAPASPRGHCTAGGRGATRPAHRTSRCTSHGTEGRRGRSSASCC